MRAKSVDRRRQAVIASNSMYRLIDALRAVMFGLADASVKRVTKTSILQRIVMAKTLVRNPQIYFNEFRRRHRQLVGSVVCHIAQLFPTS